MRLVLSGVMERHPKLKIVMSHTGARALPVRPHGQEHAEGEAAAAGQHYLKRMYTDTVSPPRPDQFAIDYYGIDNVMYAPTIRAGIGDGAC